MATSLADFWARRWNVTQALVLRSFVHEPISQGRLVVVAREAVEGSNDSNHHGGSTPPAAPPRWRRFLAVVATFVVSGVEHELFLWYLVRAADWRWLVFFSMHGVLLVAEASIKRVATHAGLRLHPRVSSLAVMLVLGLTADWLFWPPLLQPGLVAPLQALARSCWEAAGSGNTSRTRVVVAGSTT